MVCGGAFTREWAGDGQVSTVLLHWFVHLVHGASYAFSVQVATRAVLIMVAADEARWLLLARIGVMDRVAVHFR